MLISGLLILSLVVFDFYQPITLTDITSDKVFCMFNITNNQESWLYGVSQHITTAFPPYPEYVRLADGDSYAKYLCEYLKESREIFCNRLIVPE